MNRKTLMGVCALTAVSLQAQQPPPYGNPPSVRGNQPPPPGNARPNNAPPPNNGQRPEEDAWWRDPALARRLGLTADQQRRIEMVFQQNRVRLIDLSASLQKEEAVLDPMLMADRPDPARVLAQIDRVADARAALEKANGRMLLGVRSVLSADQWRRLQSDSGPPPGGPPR